jgi:hypothetical protein
MDGAYEGTLSFEVIGFESKGKSGSFSTKDFPVLKQSKLRLELNGSQAKLMVAIPAGERNPQATLSGTAVPKKGTVTLDKVEDFDLGVAINKLEMHLSGSLQKSDLVTGVWEALIEADVPEHNEETGEVIGSVREVIRASGKWSVKRLPPVAAAGALSLTFLTDGAVPLPVRELACTFVINGKEQELRTNGQGYLKVPIEVPDSSRDLVVRLKAVTISAETSFGSLPKYFLGKWTLPFEQKFILVKGKNFNASATLKLPVRDVRVSFDVPTGVTRGSLQAYAGRLGDNRSSLLRMRDDDFQGNTITLKLPALPPLAGTEVVFLGNGRDKRKNLYEGWEYVTLPGEGNSLEAVILDLRPDTLLAQFNGIKPRLRTSLESAGFTAEEIARILEVRIANSRNSSSRYWDATDTVEMPPGQNLRNGGLINLGHELGHHITNVIANDDAPHVGGSHDVHAVVHPNLAWDEGRSHFYCWAINQITRLPGERGINNNWADATEPSRRELFVYEGLVSHYGNRQLYPTIEEALQDFRNVQQQAMAPGSLGRPPRTLAEFIAVKQQTAAGRIAEDLEAMAQRFGLNH